MAIATVPLSVLTGLATEPKYETLMPCHTDPARTLVVHCSQSDLQRPVDAFMRFGLGIEAFDRIAIPGGPKIYRVDPYPISEGGLAGMRWTRLLVENHMLNRVVLIGHENCAWYRELYPDADPDTLRNRQIFDLKESQGLAVQLELLHLSVEAYFSRIIEPGVCAFFPVVF